MPGKNVATADVLSRVPVTNACDLQQEEEVNLYVDSIVQALPATETRLTEIRRQQDANSILSQLKKYCLDGWLDKFSVDPVLQPYLLFSGEFTVQNGLLLKSNRMVIPEYLRADMLEKLHKGHLGITKCRKRAKQSVWWPGLSKELQGVVVRCDTCARERTHFKKTLLPTEFPERPRSEVGADLFQIDDNHYVVIVDYFSRFFEVAKLGSTTSETVVNHFKSIFTRHGIPEVVRTDNGQCLCLSFQGTGVSAMSRQALASLRAMGKLREESGQLRAI